MSGFQFCAAVAAQESIPLVARIRAGNPRSPRAFTLVEALASLALVAIILPVALKGISLGTGAAALAVRRMEATRLVEMKLGELLATNEWQSGDLEGDFEDEWPAYTWSAEAQDWDDPLLVQLVVTVEWRMRETDYSATLTTLVYDGTQ